MNGDRRNGLPDQGEVNPLARAEAQLRNILFHMATAPEMRRMIGESSPERLRAMTNYCINAGIIPETPGASPAETAQQMAYRRDNFSNLIMNNERYGLNRNEVFAALNSPPSQIPGRHRRPTENPRAQDAQDEFIPMDPAPSTSGATGSQN